MTRRAGILLGISLTFASMVSATVASAHGQSARLAASVVTTYGALSNLQGSCIASDTSHKGKPQPTCTFTVTTPTGTTVDVTAVSTTVLTPENAAADVQGSPQNSDWIVVKGKQGSTLAANRIWFSPTPFSLPGTKTKVTSGKYVSLDTSATPPQLTIIKNSTDFLFTVTSTTHYKLNGRNVSSVAFQANDALKVTSQLYTDGNQWTATIAVTRKKKH